MRFNFPLLCCVLLTSAACHPGPVIDAGAKQPPVGGTIAGIVTTADPSVAVPGRKVTATETTTNSHYEATTALNGGYTIKVPIGTYRIDIELHEGETLAKRPDQTRINNSDLDPHRDFVITVKRSDSRRR
jgi:Carboxypeptidase regulatory-like domain